MSRMTSNPYDIARPTGACAATGRGLAPGEPIVVALVERDGEEGFDRLDFSVKAWDEGARAPGDRRIFAHWRTTQPEPNAKPRLFIDDASLVDLFEQLGQEAEGDAAPSRSRLAFRYVLALILCRKRLLRMEGSEGGDLLVRARGADAESAPVRVVDPGLDEATLREATELLGDVLAGDA